MKKIAIAFTAFTLTLSACNNTPKGDEAATTEKQDIAAATGSTFSIDSTSTVSWTGSKPTGTHSGTFKMKEGSLSVENNTITGGSFVIDINSLQNADLTEADGKSKLEGHLKSADFFDASKFPTGKFEVTAVEPYVNDSTKPAKVAATHLIKGNLTLKDSTKNISFPAQVTITDNTLNAVADFNIDRTLWGMNYKGPNNPQDWVISKDVNIKLSIKAAKK